MSALEVTRAETRWSVSFANPAVSIAKIGQPEVGARLVPGGGRARALELILGSVVLGGATAGADLATAYRAFFESATRLAV